MTRWLYLSAAATVVAAAASLYVFYALGGELPERVPTHWNWRNEPDRWTARNEMLPQFLMMPGAMLVMSGLTVVLPLLSPRHFKVDEFRGVYGYLMALAVLLLGYLQVVILMSYFGRITEPGRMFLIGIFPFFALLGNVLGKVRRNFWMGVRTPWTLASDAVWTATHRLAAYLFVFAGVVGFIAALAGAPLWFSFGLIGAAGLIPVVYSAVLYKRLERQGKL